MTDQGPQDLPIVVRVAVRLVVLDDAGRMLLFHTREPTYPELGTWWELPGGGIDGGETYREAAVRELAEETGIRVRPGQVGEPSWRRRGAFRHRGVRRVQDEVVVAVRLAGPGPAVDGSGRLDYEHEDYIGFRWWPVAEVVGSADRFYPGRLPWLLPRFLAGEPIEEPFELFSLAIRARLAPGTNSGEIVSGPAGSWQSVDSRDRLRTGGARCLDSSLAS